MEAEWMFMQTLAKELYVQSCHCYCCSFKLDLFWTDFCLLPLERKLKKGRKKATQPALMRQSLPIEEEAPRLIDVATDDEDDNEDEYEILPVPGPKWRGRKPGSGSQILIFF